MESYLIIAAIIFGGSLVQGLAGFGFALVAMPLLALMLPISGIITMKVICLWGLAIPVILAGIYIGMEFYSRIDRDFFRKTVLVLLLSLAVMLLLQV